jgi:IS30 family transposase
MVTSRIWFTAAQKSELWDRWKKGQSAAAISRALERRNKTGVERMVVLHGRIVPAPRRRALGVLRLGEREEISRGIVAGRSIRQIAQGLGRAPSTVSREIRRNGGSQAYRANRADRRAWKRALRPKPCRLALHRELRWRVAQKLALQWSPEQISGWLKQEFPTDQDMQISHEAIYRSLFIQTRGVYSRYGLHPRAACRGCGSRRAGALGRRPSYRSERHAHRHPRRAQHPLHDARQDSPQRHDDCCCCACQAHPQAA